jgi:hypothetical protein
MLKRRDSDNLANLEVRREFHYESGVAAHLGARRLVMARVPFQREIEDLFASDKSVVLKLLAGAFVGVLVALRAVLKDAKGGASTFSTPVKITIAGVAAIVGMLVVLLLLLRDVVVRRVDQGKPVNPLLRAYFGKGNGCLMVALWFFTVIFVTFIVTMLTVNL